VLLCLWSKEMAKIKESQKISEKIQADAPQNNQEPHSDPNQEESQSLQDRFLNSPKVIKTAGFVVGFLVIVLAIWGVGSLIVNGTLASPESTPTPTSSVVTLPETVPTPSFSTDGGANGVYRLPEVQFAGSQNNAQNVEERQEVTTYTVQTGDTIFGIADKFGLKPETILWANRYIIGDTPDGLILGVELYILPEDGVYHRWSEGEGLNGVAKFYGVSPDVIVNYPLNELDPETVGDYSNPKIEPGRMLIVPGGERPTVSWIIPRDNPASGSAYLGPGACGGIIYGDVGTGTFTWPTAATWLSGYDYTPPVHNGLDFDGDFGSPIYASDSGVIVYSGWSDRGYGYLIVVDHDGGWQSFYAHLTEGTLIPCGSNVQKGQLIAAMGSTGNSSGPHLHFELRLNGSPVNPWQFLN
jgi:LysM repeat protein